MTSYYDQPKRSLLRPTHVYGSAPYREFTTPYGIAQQRQQQIQQQENNNDVIVKREPNLCYKTLFYLIPSWSVAVEYRLNEINKELDTLYEMIGDVDRVIEQKLQEYRQITLGPKDTEIAVKIQKDKLSKVAKSMEKVQRQQKNLQDKIKIYEMARDSLENKQAIKQMQTHIKKLGIQMRGMPTDEELDQMEQNIMNISDKSALLHDANQNVMQSMNHMSMWCVDNENVNKLLLERGFELPDQIKIKEQEVEEQIEEEQEQEQVEEKEKEKGKKGKKGKKIKKKDETVDKVDNVDNVDKKDEKVEE